MWLYALTSHCLTRRSDRLGRSVFNASRSFMSGARFVSGENHNSERRVQVSCWPLVASCLLLLAIVSSNDGHVQVYGLEYDSVPRAPGYGSSVS